MRYHGNMPAPRLPYQVTTYHADCLAYACRALCLGHHRIGDGVARPRETTTLAQATRVLETWKRDPRVTAAHLTLNGALVRYWERQPGEGWPKTQEGAGV